MLPSRQSGEEVELQQTEDESLQDRVAIDVKGVGIPALLDGLTSHK